MISNIKRFILKGDYLIKILSNFHPLSDDLLEKYKDLWDWGIYSIGEYRAGLSGNELLPWKNELINRYNSRWAWHYLCENISIAPIINYVKNENGKQGFFDKFSKNLDWQSIAERNDLNWSLDFIFIYNSVR